MITSGTLKNMGMDLLSQTNWYEEAALELIYSTSPSPVNGEYIGFPYEDDSASGGVPITRESLI